MPLEHMKNPKTKEQCNIKWMIIAYKCTMNLGNLLSHRDLSTAPPPPPPPYMTRDMGGLCVCLVCLVCVCFVCVCVCVCLQDVLLALTLFVLVTPHEKIHASHKNLCPIQFPYPTALLRCFALPTRA